VTDIHVDKDANAEWLRQLSRRGDFINDVLIVCGDVADEITVLSDALEARLPHSPPAHNLAGCGAPSSVC
jgi:hypothetical protein